MIKLTTQQRQDAEFRKMAALIHHMSNRKRFADVPQYLMTYMERWA